MYEAAVEAIGTLASQSILEMNSYNQFSMNALCSALAAKAAEDKEFRKRVGHENTKEAPTSATFRAQLKIYIVDGAPAADDLKTRLESTHQAFWLEVDQSLKKTECLKLYEVISLNGGVGSKCIVESRLSESLAHMDPFHDDERPRMKALINQLDFLSMADKQRLSRTDLQGGISRRSFIKKLRTRHARGGARPENKNPVSRTKAAESQ